MKNNNQPHTHTHRRDFIFFYSDKIRRKNKNVETLFVIVW